MDHAKQRRAWVLRRVLAGELTVASTVLTVAPEPRVRGPDGRSDLRKEGRPGVGYQRVGAPPHPHYSVRGHGDEDQTQPAIHGDLTVSWR
jgi:hypothetical protein